MASRSTVTPLAGVLLGMSVLLLAGHCGPAPSVAIDLTRSSVTVDRAAGVIADGTDPVSVTVTIVGSDGSPVQGASVLLEATGNGNSLTGAPALTDALGRATGTLTSTRAETKVVRASVVGPGADGGAMRLPQQVSVQFVPGAAARLAFTVQPSTAQAGAPLTPAVQVTAFDAHSNVVAGNAPSISLALQSNPSSATLSGTSVLGATNGVAVFSDLRLDRAGSGYTLVASAAGLTSVTSAPFDITPGPPSRLTFLAQPQSTVSGAVLTPAVRVGLQDAFGNIIRGAASLVTLALTGGPVGATLAGTLAVDAVDGVATFTDLSITRAGSNYALAATASGYAGAQSAPFSIATAVASSSTSTLATSPTLVTAGGGATTTVTATVRDAQGNPVENQAVILSASGSNNLFSPNPPSGTTDASGVFTATLASTTAETKVVSATVGSFVLSAAVTFTAGAPSALTSSLVASTSSVVANGSGTTTLTVTVKDAYGNPAPSQAVSLSATGSGNTFAPASGVTNASGVFTATLASTRAEGKTVTATVGGFNLTTPVTFTPGPPSSSTSTFTANPTSAVANNTATITLRVTVKDAYNNLVPSQAVSLSASGTGNTFSPASGITDASGVFTATLVSTKAESKTVTATVGGFNLTTPVTFTPGPASPSVSTLTASPASVVADGAATTTLTVTVRDAYGNTLSNQPVSLSASGTGNTLFPASGTTNASGVFTATLSSVTAEAKTVTATVGTTSPFNLTASVTFTAGPPSSNMSTLVASPGPVVANGSATTTLTVTVRDVEGNPVAGQRVTLSSTGGNNTFSPNPPTGTTNASGVFTATLASTRAEDKTVTATVGTTSPFTLTTTVTFIAGLPVAATSTLTAVPTSVPANGVATSTLVVTLKDAYGNRVPSQLVVMTATGSNNTFTSDAGLTDGSGVFASALSSTTAETKVVTASVSTFTLNTTVTFTPP